MAKNNLLLEIENEFNMIASPTLAKAYGMAAATFIQKLHYILLNQAKVEHNKKKYWYHTLDEWVKCIGFYSVSTIKRVIKKLEAEGILIIKKLDECKWKRTNYYSIDYKKLQQIFAPQVTEDRPKPSPTKVAKEPLPAPVTPEKTISGKAEPQHPPAAHTDLSTYPLEYQRFYKSLRQAKLDIALDDPRIKHWMKHSANVIRQIYYARQASTTPSHWHLPEQLKIICKENNA